MSRLATILIVLLLVAGACGKDESTPTTPTPTPVEPTVTERFQGTIAVGAARFYSFRVAAYGTVNLTLTSLDGQTEPTDLTIGIGIGVPRGIECVTSTSITTTVGSAPQVTGNFAAGIFCARVHDPGTLSAPTAFTLDIAHP